MAEDSHSIEYVLGRFLYKEDVQELCDDLNLPTSGTKEDLIGRLLGHSDFEPQEALEFLDKEQVQTLCDDWDLDGAGSRETLLKRVLDEVEKPGEPAQIPDRATQSRPLQAPPPPPPPNGWAPPIRETGGPAPPADWNPPPQESEYARPAYDARSAPAEYGSPPGENPRLKDVLDFLSTWRPNQPFQDEQRYKDFLHASISAKFGETSVRDEVPITGGRIDIEIFFGIGIELKYPTNTGDLDRLYGQALKYRRHYGPNLIVILFCGGYAQREVVACARSLESLGIKVLLK